VTSLPTSLLRPSPPRDLPPHVTSDTPPLPWSLQLARAPHKSHKSHNHSRHEPTRNRVRSNRGLTNPRHASFLLHLLQPRPCMSHPPFSPTRCLRILRSPNSLITPSTLASPRSTHAPTLSCPPSLLVCVPNRRPTSLMHLTPW
jgi:hypothetical protein